VVNRRGLCRLCLRFASRHPETGPCGACGRDQPLKKGYCRLCWCQARLERDQEQAGLPRHQDLLPYVQRVRHHQLFFLGTPPRRDVVIRGVRTCGIRALDLATAPPPARPAPPGQVQLTLFAGLPRSYRFGRVDLRTDPVPASPWLLEALRAANTKAEARGWDTGTLGKVNRVLVMLLAGDDGSEQIRLSDFAATVRQRGTSVTRAAEILAALGVLADDRPTAFDTWLAAKLDGLPPRIGGETERWARALHDGTPRTRALAGHTVRGYVAAVLPLLTGWSASRSHLRQITRDDVRDATAGLRGNHRQQTFVALRSLFGWAKKNGVIFANPATGLHAAHGDKPIFQPLTAAQISQAIEAATTPQARVLVTLTAIHAARPGAIRALQLSDADLGNRRLTIAGRTRPIDDLTHGVLRDWLAYRQQRWPASTNPHLLISARTAPGTGPVSHSWVTNLQGLAATPDRLRIDRQLEEALTHHADPLHLMVVFGIDDATALRYAASARALLARPHENGPASSARTHGSVGANGPCPPVGSG
jgi:site-specific recombinase XerD